MGVAVTVEDDPEDEEDLDFSVAAAAASAALAGSSGGFGPEGLSGALGSCVESTAGAGGLLIPPSGRTAVPGKKQTIMKNETFYCHK